MHKSCFSNSLADADREIPTLGLGNAGLAFVGIRLRSHLRMRTPIAITDLQRRSNYLAIDDGENVVGAMDPAGRYWGFGPHFRNRYSTARTLLFSAEVLVVFAGDRPDVASIAAKMECTDQELAQLQAKAHNIKDLRWGNIHGMCLIDTCEEFYPHHQPPDRPSEIPEYLTPDDYAYVWNHSYCDVYRTRLLWEAFREGRIPPNRDFFLSGRYC